MACVMSEAFAIFPLERRHFLQQGVYPPRYFLENSGTGCAMFGT
jgi:hypothetical protein